jgi:phenylacetic acid degradation operon negative regulatory protein
MRSTSRPSRNLQEIKGAPIGHDGDVSSPPEARTAAPSPGAEAAARFPRPQKGSSTQHLLVTLLADLWSTSEAWIPSRLVLDLCAGLDVTPSAATTALSRLATRGVLEQSSSGRSSRYRLTPNARVRLAAAVERVFTFGSGARQWDGQWTVIAFSIPESSRELRDLFRTHLRFRGFAPLYGALWVSPWERPEDLQAGCAAFGVTDFVVFRAADDSLLGKPLIEAWPLDELGLTYQPFIDRFAGWTARCAAGDVAPPDAFRVRVHAMDVWRTFPGADPDLPLELLPDRWQVTEARTVFVQLYECLAEPALEHVRQLVARHAPELEQELSVLAPPSP